MRRASNPFGGLGVILWDSCAIMLHRSQIELGIFVALGCRFGKPSHCFRGILAETVAVFVSNAEVVLGRSLAPVGSFTEPLHRLCIMLRNASAFIVTDPQV